MGILFQHVDTGSANNLDIYIYYMYLKPMEIIWDPSKAKSNFQKHRIRFSDAESVLYDSMALTVENYDIEGEKRFVTVGSDSMGRIVLSLYISKE